ncbi:hypothetical protein AWJ20_3422 [Sugiyamaella lignohabitans]|uniref:Uncharacterized protein n=1 Tax=Sugiyamaella lignohabitans TaxID=796027 RepID=A0A167FW65_9ASCO|nr:uncharacterized protein AWJ20_3422 [Sugiyamaella lignohabitans]ANB15778.1 hypothetical protein AWJ20_3422 [Sugiyamaella lignohabitans]
MGTEREGINFTSLGSGDEAQDQISLENADSGWLESFKNIRSEPWFQVFLISFVCFCCPGIYNALGGMGGSGQVDPTVAANATVALLSTSAISAVFFVAPLYELIGPNICVLIGGWTYALYSGSLLNYNHHQNSTFVIVSGAILGIGASFLWVPQGVIMTTYINESQKGRSIAVFWIIFNLGGTIGSLASFGLNYHSSVGTVSDFTYIAYIVIMLSGWLLGSLLLCPAAKLNYKYQGERNSAVAKRYQGISLKKIIEMVKLALSILCDWNIIFLLPMFLYANVFYSYQQNIVNGSTFNIRTRSLNGALYWFAQIFGGITMGALLDTRHLNRRKRALMGWAVLSIFGMVVWGGGYKFQLWSSKRILDGHKQDLDFTDKQAIGPMFLYIFYGMFDALWQAYSYWIIGTKSNAPVINAILVGAYKTCQATGGAMAWRLNALGMAPMSQLALNWALTMAALVCVLPGVYKITDSNVKETGQETENIEGHTIIVLAKNS